MDQWIILLQTNIDDLNTDLQELVYYSFYQFVYRDTFFLVRDHARTEDIIQDAFLKIVKYGPKTHSSNMPSWIKQVTRNTTLDSLRKNKKNQHIFNLDYVTSVAHLQAASSDIANDFEEKSRNELLYQSINELKPEYQLLLLMYYMEEKSYKEICQSLNLSESVVTQRLARARKKLLQHFSRKWDNVDE
jgi:RNA polymerase sigma factor (sigma-70 family)